MELIGPSESFTNRTRIYAISVVIFLELSPCGSKTSTCNLRPSCELGAVYAVGCFQLNASKDKQMKSFKYTALTAVLCVDLASLANAHLLNPTFFTTPSPIGSPTDEASFLETNFATGPLTYLAQFNETGANESGAVDFLRGFTAFNDGPFTNAFVSWDLTGTGFQLTYALVKGGSTGGPNGQETYALYPVSSDEGLFPELFQTVQANAGASTDISHITFFGTAVPDSGTTVMLLGSALTGLGLLRRYLRSYGSRSLRTSVGMDLIAFTHFAKNTMFGQRRALKPLPETATTWQRCFSP